MPCADQIPTLICLIGPPAVGKVTVGQELARRTGIRLFHHHQVIDLLTDYFPFGTPAFRRLYDAYRTQLFDEAAQLGLSLITTSAGPLDDPTERQRFVRSLQSYTERGRRLCVACLVAPLDVLLERNRTENRRRHKKVDWATAAALRDTVAAHDWDDRGGLPSDLPYVKLDTARLSAEATAQRICESFALAGALP